MPETEIRFRFPAGAPRWNEIARSETTLMMRNLTFMKRGLLCAALLCGFGGTALRGAAQTAPTDKPATGGNTLPADDTIDPNQPIKPDFVVSVTVANEPEPSGTYTVDPAGNISIRYGGIASAISLQGLTPRMAEGEIAKFLKAYIKNPQVSVKITSTPHPTVFVGGAVKNPGPLVVTADATLMDVLSRAVWTPDADLSQVRITHREKVNGEEKSVTQIVNFDEYTRPGPGKAPDELNNPVIKDKDKIFISFKASQGTGIVSVGGEVLHPTQGIVLRTSPPMTVRELVNLAGGTTPAANRKAIVIRRPTVERPLVVDLDKAEQGDLVNNIDLRPDDAIYVEKLENNAYINVNGGWVKPGKYVYDKRTTLTQAIQEAGGPAPYSKIKEGRIERHPDNDAKNTRIIAFNYEQLSKGKSPDVELQPGDTVWITPGIPPGPKPDVFTFLNGLSSLSFLYYNFRR